MKKWGKIFGATLVLIFSVYLISFSSYPRMVLGEKDEAKLKLISEKKEDIKGEVDYFEEQIKFLTEEIEKKELEIQENEKRLNEINKELENYRSKLGESLRIIYEEEKISFWERLMTAETISAFFSQSVYLDHIHEGLSEATIKIADLKNEAEEKQLQLEEDRKMQEVMRASLALQLAEREVVLEKIEDEEELIRIKFSNMILGGSKNKYCAGEGPVVKAKYPVFRFPVNCGYISQGYGNTVFATIDKAYSGAIHNGFDVGINTGTYIYAIGNGVVYAKGVSPSGGWGNWVMTRHDNVLIRQDDPKTKDVNEEIRMSFFALYAHMVSKTHLDVGDSVTKDTTVGFVGGTPYWAPHLHFSLFLSDSGWKDGQTGEYPGNTIDPLNYMDIPISTQGTDWDVRYIHFSTK